eukprot:403333029
MNKTLIHNIGFQLKVQTSKLSQNLIELLTQIRQVKLQKHSIELNDAQIIATSDHDSKGPYEIFPPRSLIQFNSYINHTKKILIIIIDRVHYSPSRDEVTLHFMLNQMGKSLQNQAMPLIGTGEIQQNLMMNTVIGAGNGISSYGGQYSNVSISLLTTSFYLRFSLETIVKFFYEFCQESALRSLSQLNDYLECINFIKVQQRSTVILQQLCTKLRAPAFLEMQVSSHYNKMWREWFD